MIQQLPLETKQTPIAIAREKFVFNSHNGKSRYGKIYFLISELVSNKVNVI